MNTYISYLVHTKRFCIKFHQARP